MSARHAIARALAFAFAITLGACTTHAPEADPAAIDDAHDGIAPYAWLADAPIRVPGPVRWDYATADAASHRLYVAQGTQVAVVDTGTHAAVGTIPDTPGVHGVAVAPDLGRLFVSVGASNLVAIHDAATLARIATVPTGQNPDAIVYEPRTQRVLAFNGRSHDLTALDARTGAVLVASLPLGGKPEYAVADGQGLVYVNIEDTNELVALDAATLKVLARWSLAPCEEPTGLDIDPQGRLYSVCGNALMMVSDAATRRVIGQAPIGHGVDGVAWVDGQAVSANGRDGTVTMVAETRPGHFEAVAQRATGYGARTIAADRARRELYLPTADFGLPPGAPAPAASAASRPSAQPDTFRVLVLRRP